MASLGVRCGKKWLPKMILVYYKMEYVFPSIRVINIICKHKIQSLRAYVLHGGFVCAMIIKGQHSKFIHSDTQ